jgi:RHS repeat-associated protein
LDTLTYPTSTSSYRLKLAYAYQNGLLQGVSDANAGTVYWQANTMNPRGQVTQETLGNGVVTNRAFDAVTGWIGSMTSGVSGTAALQNESYLFDEMGNLTQRQNNNVGLTENFYYDGDYRLDHSTLNGTVNLQMTYNAAGNITSRGDVAGGSTWTYDATHRHAVTQAGSAANTYTYDANGNATSRNGLGITWSSYNHPLLINNSGSGESVQFAYNQNHTRWSAVYSGSSGVETTYFIGDLLEKVSGVGGSFDYRHYIYAGGTKVAVYSRTTGGVNTFRYIREDHEGSVASILNSDGTTYVKESFSAFGARRSACTWSGAPTNGALAKMSAVTRHGYTWQTALGAMGLNDMNGRIQDAVTGRFLSPDPIIQDRWNTQSFNRYSYVMNNPLSYTDPSGFEADQQAKVKPIDPAVEEVVINSPQGKSSGNTSQTPSGGTQGSSSSSGGSGGGGDGGLPQGNQNLPEVCVGSGCPGHGRSQGIVGSLLYNWLVQPAFGWIDCAGGRCSGSQELWRFTGPIRTAGGAAAGVGAVRTIGTAVNQLGPVAVATGVMQLTPDAVTGLATSLEVSGAEELDQVLLLESAEEGMSETLRELERALSGTPH